MQDTASNQSPRHRPSIANVAAETSICGTANGDPNDPLLKMLYVQMGVYNRIPTWQDDGPECASGIHGADSYGKSP